MLASALRLCVVVILLAGCFCDPVIFEDCGSKYDLQTVDIEGCRWSLPCFLTLGDDVDVTLNFVAGFSSSRLDQDVMITLNHVNQRTNVSPEPCVTTGCPISTSSISEIHSKMTIPRRGALNSRGYLTWKVFNEKQELVICYSVLIQTQSPLQQAIRRFLGDNIVDSISGDIAKINQTGSGIEIKMDGEDNIDQG